MSRARLGKIARLPHHLREEVNTRLLNGEGYSSLLDWLNTHPAALEVFQTYFQAEPASPQNLSEWRKGGYTDWLARREKADSLKSLSQFAYNLVQAGGSVADGAAAILSGQILEILENSAYLAETGKTDKDGNPLPTDPVKAMSIMASAVGNLQHGSATREKIALERQKLAQKDRALRLDREKFETLAVKKFMEWAGRKEAAAVINSTAPTEVKMDQLRALMFGSSASSETPNP